MKKLDIKRVEYVARLARLYLKEEEKERFARELDEILQFMDKLNELDTGDITPPAHIVQTAGVFRPDLTEKSLGREELLRNAPETDEDKKFFKVPKVIDR